MALLPLSASRSGDEGMVQESTSSYSLEANEGAEIGPLYYTAREEKLALVQSPRGKPKSKGIHESE